MSSIHDLLKSGNNKLINLDTSLLDTEVLLSYVLKKPREYILAHGEDEVNAEQEQQFQALIVERINHKPIAYLTSHKEFYGRDFYVDERVHIPRPATENLIDAIKRTIPADFSGTMADIGTGSGCIAITLDLEFPQAKVIATDISPEALAVAKQNAASLGAPIDFYSGDFLSALPHPVDIIISNPPYGWNNEWTHDKEIFFQPAISHQSGLDGLDAIRRIINNLPNYLTSRGRAFIEFDPRQSEKIKKIAATMRLDCEIIKDLSGFDRIAYLANK